MNRDQEILEYLRGILSVEQEIKLKDNMIVFFTTYDGCFSLDKNHSICGNIWNNLSFYHDIDTQHLNLGSTTLVMKIILCWVKMFMIKHLTCGLVNN